MGSGGRRLPLVFVLAMVAERAAGAALLAATAYALGLAGGADSYFVALTIPAMAAAMLVDGFFAAVLGAWGRAEDEDGRWRAWRDHAIVFSVILIVLAGALAAGAGPLVAVLAPGKGAAWLAAAARVQRLAALLLPVQGAGMVLATALIGCGRAALGAARGTVAVVVAAGVALALAVTGNGSPTALVGAQLAGAGIAALALAVPVAGEIRRRRPRWGRPSARGAGATLKRLVTVGGVNLTHNLVLVVERAVASFLAPGAIAALSVARIAPSLIGAVPSAAATGGYAAQMAAGGRRPVPSRVVLAALAFAAPAVVLLLLRAPDVVRLLFAHGRFTAADTARVAELVRLFCLGAPFYVLSTALIRLLQADGRDRAALVLSAVGTALYLPLALWWGTGGAVGLVMAYGVAMDATVLAMIVALGAWRGLGGNLARLGLATAIALAAGAASLKLTDRLGGAVAPLLATGLVVLAFYAGAVLILNLPLWRRPTDG